MNNPKKPATVLVVDDESHVLDAMRAILDDDFFVLTASGGREALGIIRTKSVDLVFLDIAMKDIGGVEVLSRIREYDENLPVIMATATDSAKVAIKTMRMGSFGYVTKPFDPDEIIAIAQKAVEKLRLVKEIVSFRSRMEAVKFDTIIGKSRPMKEVYRVVGKVVKNDATVLICGESGTGKELIARAIHFNSPRVQKPFITIDCASIPENLMESELFGHEKGSFTDATVQRVGMFELADEGTLFLDEISDLKPDMQAKLLRVLQEREIKRVGGTKLIKVDVRIISATNIDLIKAMEEGRFRRDLYYRLNVVPIGLPPLRERKEDIPLLAEHFLNIYNQALKKKIRGFTKEALACLMDYDWPGNVRELKNIIERLVALKENDTVSAADIPFDISVNCALKKSFQSKGPLRGACRDFEKQYIKSALDRTGGNQSEAARVLGIHRNVLLSKMKSLGLKN